MNIVKQKPFGVKYLEKANDGKVKTTDMWSWCPSEKADIDYININASMPSTTGTGPRASSDERQEEMG